MGWQCPTCNIQVEPDSDDTSKCAHGRDARPYRLQCCNCAKSNSWTRYDEKACAHCKARAPGDQRAVSRQKEEELRQREEQLRQREEQLHHVNTAAKPQQVQVLVPAAAGLCPPHDFESHVVQNHATNRNGGLNASTPVGIGAGLNAQSEHDYGQRVVSICKKCGKTLGELGAPIQSSRLENDAPKGGCCVVT
jgi:hypothetical protein